MKTVPYHSLPPVKNDDVEFHCQQRTFDKRSVLVGYSPNGDRVIKITNRIDDETISELEFFLSKEASKHLTELLLYVADEEEMKRLLASITN